MPKIAITGKGGVGKTTLAALLAHIYAEAGQSVIAIDADPAASLPYALGLPDDLLAQLTPIAEMEDLIYERTGAKPGTVGGFFTLNPRVDDIPDRFSVTHRGIRLLQLGTISAGGSGCICPESAILKALVTHVILYRNEVMILDMEAGLEHLGRAPAGAVDAFLIVVEPGRRSLSTAQAIQRLAADIGVKTCLVVGNKVRGEADRDFIRRALPDSLPVIGFLSADPRAVEADMRGEAIFDAAPQLLAEAREIVAAFERATGPR
ncbi:MAG: carbon monoxide dehydrogenase [Caldilineae bacterium]|nr:MAG: carbon monoxide dehydrogenase [Caldilineae bacterium]